MGDAYRDDLAAAQARVADLEREHTALAAQNATLEAAAAPGPAPAPVRRARRKMTGGEFAVYALVCAAVIGLSAFVGISRDAGKLVLIVVALGTQALIKMFRARAA